MSRSQRRRLSRLEKIAEPAFERVKQADEATKQNIERASRQHALIFAALAVYGDPRPDEPLRDAWARCRQSAIWQNFRRLELISPFDSVWTTTIADYLEQNWLPSLPGASDKEKLDPIFMNAPPWLIWFTFADWTANFLRLELPDLSEIKKFKRSKTGWELWPCLPEGKFEFRPKPPLDVFDISESDAAFMQDFRHIPEDRMTRLERKRYLDIHRRYLKFLYESGQRPELKTLFEDEPG